MVIPSLQEDGLSPSREAEAVSAKRERLQQLTERVLGQRTLVVASNRGPVAFSFTPDGQVTSERGSGGVITALSAISQYANPIWVAAAMSDADRAQAQQNGDSQLQWTSDADQFRLSFVVAPQQAYDWYYNVIANPLLWFLQHNMWDAPRTPTITPEIWQAWHEGYEAVNRLFADRIAAEMSRARRPLVMLHDYHLYRCPVHLRPKLPDDAVLHHFMHIPCPGPDYWAMLPPSMRQAIFRSLCVNDIVGLQTDEDGMNFIRACESFLPDATVDYRRGSIELDGRTTWVRSYPISIDTVELKRFAQTEPVQKYRRLLQRYVCEKTIVRVDRVEPSKNILRGFEAYELLLKQHPEYLGKICFLAFLVPSRLDISQYRKYLREISGVAMWINAEYGTGEWDPITLFVGENYQRAVAGMQLYDVLMVNPIVDGMNLVSKEGPTVNERNGVLVLSEGAGSFEQLNQDAITVSPYDLAGTAEALHQALQMDENERRARSERIAAKVADEDLIAWLASQLDDVARLERDGHLSDFV